MLAFEGLQFTQQPHGCEPPGAHKYPIGDGYKDQIAEPTQKGGVSVKRPISDQVPIDVDRRVLCRGSDTGSGQRALGSKRLQFNWDGQSRGCMWCGGDRRGGVKPLSR